MSLPSRIIPVQNVQNGVWEVIEYLGALVRIDHHVKVGSLKVYGPSMEKSILHQGFEVRNKMAACIVGVDHLEGLKKALVCGR